MRVKTKANVKVSADTDGKDVLFALDDTGAETILDGYQEVSSGTVQVAPSSTFDIPFGGVTDARGIFVKVTGSADLVLNGSPALSLTPGQVSPLVVADSAKASIEALISSASVTNNGTAAITLTWALWGDPLVA